MGFENCRAVTSIQFLLTPQYPVHRKGYENIEWKEKLLWSFNKFSQLAPWWNVRRSVERICIWILGVREWEQTKMHFDSPWCQTVFYIVWNGGCPIRSMPRNPRKYLAVLNLRFEINHPSSWQWNLWLASIFGNIHKRIQTRQIMRTR